MRLSRYFLPVLKENPAEAQIVSHRLMLRAGMIKQATAGISDMSYEIEQQFASANMVVFEGILKYAWNDTRAGKTYKFSIREVSVIEIENEESQNHIFAFRALKIPV